MSVLVEVSSRVMTVLGPLEDWAYNCHGASTRLVESGVLPPCRVARGSCTGVSGQHSWVILGDDCYDPEAQVIDPTLWSYDPAVKGVWYGTYAEDGRHYPHGAGNVWRWGRPDPPTGPVVELTPAHPWSARALCFLELLGPLDAEGWRILAHAPVEGWPAAEILNAICDSGLEAYVPIDIRGMVCDRIPSYRSAR